MIVKDMTWPSLGELAENVLKEKYHSVFVLVDAHPDFVGGVNLFPVALSA